MNKKIYVKTYGCQMNEYDTIKMQDLMKPHGYSTTDQLDDADLVVLNTCNIREKAAEKTYCDLGRVNIIKQQRKAENKDMIIAVAGCVAQAEAEEIFARTPYVDIVVGPQSFSNLPEMVNGILNENKKHLINLEFEQEDKFSKLPEESMPQGVSAYLSIQEGCDKFCTYCVVPYTRGAEFSRPIHDVYRESVRLAESGSIEINLLGQNVTGYHGKGLDGNNATIADLIRHIAKIDSIKRIRYTTSHPNDTMDDLIALHGEEEKLMPFLHLPVQSGSNNVLKLMNRKHTREKYFELIEKFKAARPDMAFSSDFIVGFPGETDKDFEDTLDLVKRVNFSQCYSFKFSPRPGTPAALWEDQVPEEVKSERLTILQALIFEQQTEFNKSCIGKIMPVLFDRKGKYEGQMVGKTPYMQAVHVNDLDGKLEYPMLDIKITECFANTLRGELVMQDA